MAQNDNFMMPPIDICPGDYISDELTERQMSIANFAEAVGMSVPDACDLIEGKKKVTPDIAEKLEQLFGLNKKMWLTLQQSYERMRRYHSDIADTQARYAMQRLISPRSFVNEDQCPYGDNNSKM